MCKHIRCFHRADGVQASELENIDSPSVPEVVRKVRKVWDLQKGVKWGGVYGLKGGYNELGEGLRE